MGWLSDADNRRLSVPYPAWEGTGNAGPVIARRIGAQFDSARALADLLLRSLDQDALGFVALGIDQVRTRVLISDHMVAASATVVDNLVAQLIAYRSWESSHVRTAELMGLRRPGGPAASLPIDDVPFLEEAYHRRAFFLATGAILDNMAAVIIGICGLPLDLRMAAWAGVVKQVTARAGLTPPDPVCAQLRLPELIGRSGPRDWLAWALATRHMLVHRPDRIVMSRGASGAFLPRKPALTDVEMMARPAGRQRTWLTEESQLTLAGVRASTSGLVQDISELLCAIWIDRLSGRTTITQPARQWADPPTADGFEGYAPGSPGILEGMDWIMVPESLGLRLRSAGLTDDRRREVWGS